MSEVFRGVHHIEVDGGYVSWDTSYFPIVVLWWGGTSNEALIDESWAYRDANFINNTEPLMIFINLIEDAKAPDAKIRKYLADKGQFDPHADRIRSVVMVSSAIMRGVMTAVKWIAGDKFPLELTGNIEHAFKVAQKMLQDQTGNLVDIPTKYEIPRNPKAKL